MMEYDRRVLTYIEVIKTAKDYQGQRLAGTCIDHLKEFMSGHIQDKNYKGVCIVVAQSPLLKPHGFFAKHGFKSLPSYLRGLKIQDCNMAAWERLSHSDFIEDDEEDNEKEEIKCAPKGPAQKNDSSPKPVTAQNKKRNIKANEKADDGASVVSHVTNKTASGAIAKHCSPCGGRLISGANYSRHCD